MSARLFNNAARPPLPASTENAIVTQGRSGFGLEAQRAAVTRSAAVWGQKRKLVGTVIAAGAAGEGSSVSISHDGNTAIVGRPGDGAARIYTRMGGLWTQQATLVPPISHEGLSVSLSGEGNTAISLRQTCLSQSHLPLPLARPSCHGSVTGHRA